MMITADTSEQAVMNQPPEETRATEDRTPESRQTELVVYFKRPPQWREPVYVYFSNPTPPIGEVDWPGVPMDDARLEEGEGWYVQRFFNLTAASFVFTDGQERTPDLYRDRSGWYYTDNTWYDDNPDRTAANRELSQPVAEEAVGTAQVAVAPPPATEEATFLTESQVVPDQPSTPPPLPPSPNPAPTPYRRPPIPPQEIFHALVLEMHQPSGNLERLLDTGEWEAKEILFAYDRMARFLGADAELARLARVNATFSGILLETLANPDFQRRVYGIVKCGDLLHDWQERQRRGSLEVLGTGYYHPLFALIPEADWDAQIGRGSESAGHFFPHRRPGGFWPPDLAFDMRLIPHLKRAGYRYVIVDDEYVRPLDPMSWHELRYRPHLAEYGGEEIVVVVRDRELSKAQLAGMDYDWFYGELLDRTKHCEFPPLVTTATPGENGGWFRNVDEEANFWGHCYRPALDAVRAGLSLLRPTLITDYLDRFGAHGRVHVERGAWNTEQHHGWDFAQWQGSEAQRRTLERVRDVSSAFHRIDPSLSPDQREEAYWPLLRAEASDNFFWGDAWLDKAHRDLDVAAEQLGIAREGLLPASDQGQQALRSAALPPPPVTEQIVYLSRPEPADDRAELMAARLTGAGITRFAEVSALSRDELQARLGPDIDSERIDGLRRAARNMELVAYNRSVGAVFDASSDRCACRDCEAATSPAAYLADLLAYTMGHMRRADGPITASNLEDLFHQPLTRLSTSCAAVETPISQVRLCIEVLRKHLSPRVPFYRLRGPVGRGHFYTISPDIRDRLIREEGYQSEGIAGYVFAMPGEERIPLYRLFAPSNGDHFYTTSREERDNALDNLEFQYDPRNGYVDQPEGISCFVPHSSDREGQSLFRLVLWDGTHFYTTSEEERDGLLARPEADVREEGEACRVFARAGVFTTEIGDYTQAAYRALLIGLGTSYEELIAARGVSPEQRAALAQRLGLSVNDLEQLLPNPVTEAGLESIFGLRSTQRDLSLEYDPSAPLPASTVETRRLAWLSGQWLAQDWPEDPYYDRPDQSQRVVPIIDPDLIGPDDFRSPVDSDGTAFHLWVGRRALIDRELTGLKAHRSKGLDATLRSMQQPTSGTDVRPWPESQQPRGDLLQLHQQVVAAALGRERAEELKNQIENTYRLSLDALARLVAIGNKYQRWEIDPARNPPLYAEEVDEIDNILIQARKVSLYPDWIREEQGLVVVLGGEVRAMPVVLGAETFWPSLAEPVEGAWPPTEERPYIDPERVSLNDLPTGLAGETARRLYDARVADIAKWRATLREDLQRSADPEAGLRRAFGDREDRQTWRNRLTALRTILLGSTDETEVNNTRSEIANRLKLDEDEFLRLTSLIERYGQLEVSAADVTDATSILVSAYARRNLSPRWGNEEANIPYWQLLRMRRPLWRASAEARAAWTRALRTRSQPPIIDPDQVDFAMLASWQATDAACHLWRGRSAWIGDQLADLDRRRRAESTPVAGFDAIVVQSLFDPQVIASVTAAELIRSLAALFDNMDRERDATRRIEQLGMTRGAFMALMRSRVVLFNGGTLLDDDWESVYAILLQVMKRCRYAEWRDKERTLGISLNPDFFVLPQETRAPSDLPAWRASYTDMLDWQDRLQSRIDQQEAVRTALQTLILQVEARYLPALRDRLIAMLPPVSGRNFREKVEWVTDNLFIDAAESGQRRTTRVQQAIESLQVLLSSARTGQLDEYPDLRLDAPTFDEDWRWLGSYATWRSAVFVFLYPENLLRPSLRQRQTPAFRQLVAGLRSESRMTPSRAQAYADVYAEYFRDVCSLPEPPDACAVATTARYPGSENNTPHEVEFLFALAPASSRVYWSVIDNRPTEPQFAQSFWEHLSQLSDPVTQIIGAATQSNPPGFVYLFAITMGDLTEKLVFIKYHLGAGTWDGEATELSVPGDSALPFETWLTFDRNRPNPGAPPMIAIRRGTPESAEIYRGSISPRGTGWERGQPTPFAINDQGSWQTVGGDIILASPSVGVRSMVTGDFDGDGRDELLVGDEVENNDPSWENDFWLIDFSNNTWNAVRNFNPSDEGVRAVRPLVGSFFTSRSEVLIGQERISRDWRNVFPGVTESRNIVADPLGDMFWSYWFDGNSWVRRASSPRYSVPTNLPIIDQVPKLTAIGRFTKRSSRQVVIGVGMSLPGKQFQVFEFGPFGEGRNRFIWGDVSQFDNPTSWPISFIFSGDFDGDGYDEICLMLAARDNDLSAGNDFIVMDFDHSGSRQWRILGRASNSAVSGDLSTDQLPAAFAVVADFDGDGRDEFVAAPFSGLLPLDPKVNNLVLWYADYIPGPSDTDRNINSAWRIGAPLSFSGWPYAVQAVSLDFDTDGQSELAILPRDERRVLIAKFDRGNNRFFEDPVSSVDFEAPIAFLASGNFNGTACLAAVPGQQKTYISSVLPLLRSEHRFFAVGDNARIRVRSFVRDLPRQQPCARSNTRPIFAGPYDITIRENTADRRRRTESAIDQNEAPARPRSNQYYIEEAFYFVPIQIGIALQQAGHYVAALDWFRTVYDYSQPENHRKVYYGLALEEQRPLSYDRVADWLRDPLAPHRIAENRRLSYTRFTVQQIVRCLLDYADAEFTRDTAESLPIARTLYITAQELLASPDLAQPSDPCGAQIDRIPIDLGGPAFRQALLRLRAELGKIDDLGKLTQAVDTVIEILQPTDASTSLAERIAEAGRIVADVIEPRIFVPPIIFVPPGTIVALVAQPLPEGPETTHLQPDGAFTADGIRASALLADQPVNFFPSQVAKFCVPRNPILRSLRLHADLNLFKLRDGRNIAGVRRELDLYAAPTDTVTGLPAIGSEGQLILPLAVNPRPTPYRYAALIERAHQLVQIAQQMEGALLAALEKRDAEAYQVLKARQDARLARAGVTLQELRVREAEGGVELARLQRDRAQTQLDGYQQWIDGGENEWETALLQAYSEAGTARSIASRIDTLIQAAGAAYQYAAEPRFAAFMFLATSARGMANTAAIDAETRAQIASFRASHARKFQEWTLARDLARQDVAIGAQQIRIAEDHVRVTEQERTIANIQADSADQTIEFLNGKFTSVELYDWMIGVLQGVYRYFLQQATGMAQLASQQLAFERAEPPEPVIQSDYWETASAEDALSSGEGRGPDRRGLTGSARLLQDITRLDQQAFESNRRRLQLVKTVSLSQLAPVEFYRFRESGLIAFNVPLDHFDRDFPGHYHRLIRRVRTSIVALIPPTQGIRATLTSTGTSRVVVGDTLFQTIRLRRDPETVALTSPINATGLFELEAPPAELNLPFEWCGVDMTFELRMPRAANPFDYQTIADVLFTIEYTALDSYDYRQQVLQTMRPTLSSERPFSFRQEFADAWYDLHNPQQSPTPMTVRFDIRREDFAPNLDGLSIQHIAFYVARSAGSRVELRNVGLYLTPADGGGRFGGNGETREGLISTRQGNAGSWSSLQAQNPVGTWELQLPGSQEDLRSGAIQDILLVITYGGRTPAWP